MSLGRLSVGCLELCALSECGEHLVCMKGGMWRFGIVRRRGVDRTTALSPAQLIVTTVVKLTLLLILVVGFGIRTVVSVLLKTVAVNIITNVPLARVMATMGSNVDGALGNVTLLMKLNSVFKTVLRTSNKTRALTIAVIGGFNSRGTT